MTNTSKIALAVLMTGAVALSTQASPITGSISFSGSVNGYTGANGTGSLSADYTTDKSLVFTGITVNSSPAPSGSYAGLGGQGVTIFSPLAINPTGTPPVPGSQPLWYITGNTAINFLVSTLTETSAYNPVTGTGTMNLFGTGTLQDGNPADSVTGFWNASFTSAGGTNIATFSFSSSVGVLAPTVPDSGTSLMFLGMGVAALAGFATLRKQIA